MKIIDLVEERRRLRERTSFKHTTMKAFEVDAGGGRVSIFLCVFFDNIAP